MDVSLDMKGNDVFMTAAAPTMVRQDAGQDSPPSVERSKDAALVKPGLVETFIKKHSADILDLLLEDRTMRRNIVWADDEYTPLGKGYAGEDEITVARITGDMSGLIQTREEKESQRQALRTRARAEVFTPSWLCNRMNNYLDREWFGRDHVFNKETGRGWKTVTDPIEFPETKGRGWHAYVESTRLEITCGEAPFLCSRYDTVSGDTIPVRDRIGILDRKLRVVGENCATRKTWVKWALAALKSVYGYEYQGDNLLIARINIFETFVEHMRERWNTTPTDDELAEIAQIISWNLWQMDGLTDAPPADTSKYVAESTLTRPKHPEAVQDALFDDPYEEETDNAPLFETIPLCIIYDWENNTPTEYATIKGEQA